MHDNPAGFSSPEPRAKSLFLTIMVGDTPMPVGRRMENEAPCRSTVTTQDGVEIDVDSLTDNAHCLGSSF